MSLSHHGAHPDGAHPGPHQDLALSPGQPSGLLLGLPVAPPALTVHFYAAAKVTLLGHKIKHPAEAGVAALPSQVSHLDPPKPASSAEWGPFMSD